MDEWHCYGITCFCFAFHRVCKIIPWIAEFCCNKKLEVAVVLYCVIAKMGQ